MLDELWIILEPIRKVLKKKAWIKGEVVKVNEINLPLLTAAKKIICTALLFTNKWHF